jgi:hypothetical protein
MAVTTKFGVPVDGATATLMPKLQYRFRVNFTNLGSNATSSTQNVISAGRPSLTHEEVIVDSYNSKMYIAGKHTWEPISIVLRDDVNSNVVKMIGLQLTNQLDHNTQGAGISTDGTTSGLAYKFDMSIDILDGSADAQVLDQWQMTGCYLSNVQYGDLNYGTSEMVQVTMQVRYDNASHVVNGNRDLLSNENADPSVPDQV